MIFLEVIVNFVGETNIVGIKFIIDNNWIASIGLVVQQYQYNPVFQ